MSKTVEDKVIHKDLSYRIVGLAMKVHNELGHGFLEKVYENALMVLLKREGVEAVQQAARAVRFMDEVVGEYVADILVEGKVLLELKSTEKIVNAHRAQAINYLKATGLQLAIILNFGRERLEYERLVFYEEP